MKSSSSMLDSGGLSFVSFTLFLSVLNSGVTKKKKTKNPNKLAKLRFLNLS